MQKINKTLAEELSQGRKALTEKAACITTNNCNRKFFNQSVLFIQNKVADLLQNLRRYNVVLEGGKLDSLSAREIERCLGFPTNYTQLIDATPYQRKCMLGETFAIPVIEYLLCPLQKIAMLEELKVVVEEPVFKQLTLTQQFRNELNNSRLIKNNN